MHWQIFFSWTWFCVALALACITSILMAMQARFFYTKQDTVHRFSIIDLELAATPQTIYNTIKGIFKLPEDKKDKSLSSLKSQLLLDFLFMPGVYGAVFFACMHVSYKMQKSWSINIFVILAWAQCLCWLCDIIENIYLLKKIKPTVMPSSKSLHTAYQNMELFKWGVSLTGAVCAIAALFYFWVSGNYSQASLPYVGIVTAEIILFLVGGKLIAK